MPHKIATRLIALGILVMLLPIITPAQTNINSSTLSGEMNVSITPNHPSPNQDVSISLSMYTEDLNSADITWYKDGKIVSEGKGKTEYSFKTGQAGIEVKIRIVVELLNGLSFSKSFSINPASVDLIWEANSYTPPFYKGKALHPRQGSLKIVAMPEFVANDKRLSPERLVYKWSNSAKSYQEQSGYGKNVLILDGSILGKTETIRVSVTDPSSGLSAEKSINIAPSDPQIVFYKNDPYYGYIFDSAVINSFNLSSEEVQILAAPYYFTKERSGRLSYEWRLNNQLISNLAGSRIAIFKKPETGGGQSSISLDITNSNRILQQAESGLIMDYTK